MTRPIERDAIYRGRRFQSETIEPCVRWYITYRSQFLELGSVIFSSGHTQVSAGFARNSADTPSFTFVSRGRSPK